MGVRELHNIAAQQHPRLFFWVCVEVAHDDEDNILLVGDLVRHRVEEVVEVVIIQARS